MSLTLSLSLTLLSVWAYAAFYVYGSKDLFISMGNLQTQVYRKCTSLKINQYAE